MALFTTTSCFLLLSWLLATSSANLYTHSVAPNFTASYRQWIDNDGAFLQSLNATFKASISPPNFYFSVVHSASNTVIWTANTNINPISESAKLLLTGNGLAITDGSGRVLWSTPKLDSRVASMQLRDSGNLLLLDQRNVSLWETFEYPTDTVVTGQTLPVGVDLSAAEYRLLLTNTDVVLQWKGMSYWQLSRDGRAFKNSNAPLSFMSVNASGLYCFGDDGSTVVFQLQDTLAKAESDKLVFAKLGSNGKFSINGYDQRFQFPAEDCNVPSICGKLGFCTNAICSCPPAFHTKIDIDGCVPINPLFTLPEACNGSKTSTSSQEYSYLKFGDSIDYFATRFVKTLTAGSFNLSYCQHLCSQNCSCLGILYGNSSSASSYGSCYPIHNNVGSFFSRTFDFDEESFSGYIKTLVVSSDINQSSRTNAGRKFSAVALALVSSSGCLVVILFVVAGFLWWRRRRSRSRTCAIARLGSNNSSAIEDEIISVPGLPVRFKYEELVSATDNFKTIIGSGGFGTVFKGTLPDESVVAVKKMNNIGVEGNKDFCTEIAIIGHIRHANLVKLRGFCVQGGQRYLVYEYMNKGSADQAIFNGERVLEWKERVEIAVGTARGLAYLHSGCQQKIIHCDIKPENILLHNNLQVKISDFGISKLVSREDSNLLTTLRGTRGYLAPEWLTSSGISDKSDVYSFGMVLLELVRGRRNLSIQAASNRTTDDDVVLLERVYFPLLALEMHEKKRYMELADPRLEGRVKSEEVEKLVRVALCCVQLYPTLRPTMSDVVRMLEGSLPLGQPRIESLNFLRYYGLRYAEAVTTSNQSSVFYC